MQAESQYLLKGEINKESLTDFIRDYVSNVLPRWHRTTDVQPRSSGFSFGPTQTIHLSRYNSDNVVNCKENMVCVEELSYSNFKTKVLENTKVI